MYAQIKSYYQTGSWRERLHVAIRLKTCPFERMERFVPHEGIILDFGCGHGIFSLLLKIAQSRRTVVGYDAASSKVACANKISHQMEGLHFVDDESYVDAGPFDAIVLSDILCFVQDKESLLKKLARLLKPQGKLIIKDIAREKSIQYLWTYWQDFFAKNILHITKADGLYYVSPSSLQEICNRIDVSNIRFYDLRAGYLYPHFVLVGDKCYAEKESSSS